MIAMVAGDGEVHAHQEGLPQQFPGTLAPRLRPLPPLHRPLRPHRQVRKPRLRERGPGAGALPEPQPPLPKSY